MSDSPQVAVPVKAPKPPKDPDKVLLKKLTKAMKSIERQSAVRAVQDVEAELAEVIGKETHNPSRYVKWVWKWADGDLKSSEGPREWQRKILDLITRTMLDPKARYQPLRIAVSSGNGIGKSALISMISKWALDTCPDTKIIVTATTGQQLKTKTWPEVNKWYRNAVTQHWWDVRAESVISKQPAHEQTWRMDQITWSLENKESFSGLHNEGKRIVLIFDEASGIADEIWDVAEGALTDLNTEIIWVAFGNPLKAQGRFKECFTKFKHRWHCFQVDSRQVEGTNKEFLQSKVDDLGEDSDWVRAHIRGEFPRHDIGSLISQEWVAMARKFKSEGHELFPKILAVDVARFGDDQTVIGSRQGRKAVILAKATGLSTTQVTAKVIEAIEAEKPEGIVVDGDGIGAGVVDQLRDFGYSVFEFHGGERANDFDKYYNRRAEVWGLLADWLEAGQCQIPDDPALEEELTSPEYHYNVKNQIQLERKDEMKARGLSSPDLGDMLAMTFAITVRAKNRVSLPKFAGMSQQWTGTSWMMN